MCRVPCFSVGKGKYLEGQADFSCWIISKVKPATSMATSRSAFLRTKTELVVTIVCFRCNHPSSPCRPRTQVTFVFLKLTVNIPKHGQKIPCKTRVIHDFRAILKRESLQNDKHLTPITRKNLSINPALFFLHKFPTPKKNHIHPSTLSVGDREAGGSLGAGLSVVLVLWASTGLQPWRKQLARFQGLALSSALSVWTRLGGEGR